MAFSDDQLTRIYDRTSGYCHICSKKLAFTNYARNGRKGAWEVEHSVPKACGGTDRLNNLYAACIPCNRSKQARSTRSCRADNGRSKAPHNRHTRKRLKTENALAGAGLGALAGSVFGPLGTLIGSVAGAYLGHKENPDR